VIEGVEKVIRKWPRRVVATVFVAVMVAATLVAAIWIVSVDKTPPEAPSTELKRVPVEVAAVQPESFTHHIKALGTVKPFREASVAPQVAGPIVEVADGVDLGARVEKGELLARIKQNNYAIALREAEAHLAQRQAAYEEQRRDSEKTAVLFKISEENLELVKAEAGRIEALYNEGVVSRSENDAARERLTKARSEHERIRSEYYSSDAILSRVAAEIDQAEASQARAERDLADTRITAPFTGLIAEKAADVGDHLAVGQSVFRLLDISRVKVLINIPTEDIHAIKAGSRATVTVTPLPDRPFRGVVAHIGYEGEIKNRTFPVEVLVENPSDLPLRPSMFATVRMAVRTYEDIILIDRSLIARGPNGPMVFVADSEAQVARARQVTLGRLFDDRYQVLRGLASGELLITEGVDLLSDGSPIRLPQAATAATE
jgi:multidrug efflux pump subunit AcrA (membrane-fusion protein)